MIDRYSIQRGRMAWQAQRRELSWQGVFIIVAGALLWWIIALLPGPEVLQ